MSASWEFLVFLIMVIIKPPLARIIVQLLVCFEFTVSLVPSVSLMVGLESHLDFPILSEGKQTPKNMQTNVTKRQNEFFLSLSTA